VGRLSHARTYNRDERGINLRGASLAGGPAAACDQLQADFFLVDLRRGQRDLAVAEAKARSPTACTRMQSCERWERGSPAAERRRRGAMRAGSRSSREPFGIRTGARSSASRDRSAPTSSMWAPDQSSACASFAEARASLQSHLWRSSGSRTDPVRSGRSTLIPRRRLAFYRPRDRVPMGPRHPRIARFERFSTKYSRLISAHCSTPITHSSSPDRSTRRGSETSRRILRPSARRSSFQPSTWASIQAAPHVTNADEPRAAGPSNPGLTTTTRALQDRRTEDPSTGPPGVSPVVRRALYW